MTKAVALSWVMTTSSGCGNDGDGIEMAEGGGVVDAERCVGAAINDQEKFVVGA